MTERCLLVSSFMAKYKGGYINSIIKLIEKMHENGDEIFIIFPKTKTEALWLDEIKAMGCKVYLLEYKPYSLNNIKFIRKVVKDEKINLIYSDFTGWDITARLAKPFMSMIWHERMRVNAKDPVKVILNFIKFRIIGAFKTCSVGISDDVYNSLCRLAGKKRAVKIYDAAAVERFDLSLPRKNNEIKKFLMFSYTPIVKGVDIAFDAMEKLNKDEIKAKLVLVSHGVCDDYVKDRYPVLPEWLEIQKPREDVEHYYFDCDCFVSASRSEGFSQSLMEALYSGMPAIVSDIPGTSWSKDFKGVTVFESGNPDSLYDAFILKGNCEIDKDNVKFNRKKTETEYSVESWTQNVISLHQKILRG